MASRSFQVFILFVLVALSFPGLEMAFPGGNRRLLAPSTPISFPGLIPGLTTPPLTMFPDPTLFPPLLPSPGADVNPSTPSLPDFPPFPPAGAAGTPSLPTVPVLPPPQAATTP